MDRNADLNSDIANLLKNLKGDPQKQKQWSAFLQRIRVAVTPPEFAKVIAVINDFLLPLFANFQSDRPRSLNWKATGPWKSRGR